MHIDLGVALAGLIVGFTVGLTGMGGGALMTPILVILFKVQPLAAVSSDLVAAVVMKPVGGGVHVRRGTVNWSLVRWLALGSVPSAFFGVFLLRLFGSSDQLENRLKILLGVTLLFASASIVARGILQMFRARRREEALEAGRSGDPGPFVLKRWRTLTIGVVGGLMVGMTSVGSGSLIIVALILLYPMLRMKQLVGTDLVQAIPLVASAALGHILFGDFQFSLTASVLLGSVPGVYLGARASARAPDGVVRPALVFVLVASALKLLNMPTTLLGLVLVALIVVGLQAWGLLDAAGRPAHHWTGAGYSKRAWLGLQAPVGLGFAAAIAYFQRVRPKLVRAGVASSVAVLGDEVPVPG